MSDGPPPVPGGRSPEEREAARREREARRAGQGGAPPPEPPPPERDWLAEAERLTAPPPAEPARDGAGPPADGRVTGLPAGKSPKYFATHVFV